MKNLIFTILLLCATNAYANDRAVLQNGQGTEVGTSANPLQVTISGGVIPSAAGWTDNGPTVTLTTSTDNVGIGTTSTAVNAKLRIDTGGTNPILFGQDSGSTTFSAISFNNLLTEGYLGLASSGSDLFVNATNRAIFRTGAGAPPTEAMRIDGSQNIGIGTTVLNNKVSIGGGLGVGATFSTVTAPANGAIVQGNVSIGTTATQAALTITGGIFTQSNTSPYIGFTGAVGGNGDFVIEEKNTPAYGLGIASMHSGVAGTGIPNGYSVFLDAATFAVVANVGIGSFSPTNKPHAILEVAKQANVPPFMVSSNQTAAGDYITIDTAGNVGIGSLAPGVKLDVVGTVRVSTGTAGQAACFKTDKSLGQCTSIVGAGGGCTCS